MDSSDLYVELVCDSLELVHFNAKVRKSDVNGCSQSCAKVGGARCDVS